MVKKYLWSPFYGGQEVYLVGEIIADQGEYEGQVISCIVPKRLTPKGDNIYQVDENRICIDQPGLFKLDGSMENNKIDFIEAIRRDVEYFCK